MSKDQKTTVPRSIVVGLARELYDKFVMGGWEPQDSYELIEAVLNPMSPPDWSCAARRHTGTDPVDCDWPGCGCDPYANKVISAIEEAGWSIVK